MGGELVTVTSADGTRLGVEVVGSGPPLLAVHGGTADRTRWTPLVPHLADRFTLHLLDRRGRGASTEESDGQYALEREADDVVAVCEAIGAPVRLLGHSYGGLIGMEALTRTEAIERALLYEPAFDTPGHRIAPPDAFDRLSERLAADDREGALDLFYREIIRIDPAPLKAQPVWQARLAAVHTIEREGRIGLTYAVAPQHFAAVDVPVRILAGTESPPAFGAAARAARDAIPGSDLVWLEGQGHTMIDADTAGFARHVVDFLG
ncbi:MAG: alpha/beta fold hydrolase [Actinomycetota bacterium]|nr:alpha/beta fold hydrolase [Actinomycetota bacterium]